MRIARPLLDRIVEHAVRDAPNECCGLVARRDGDATAVHELENVEASPLRFDVDGLTVFGLLDEMEDGGDELGAIYHSHTRSDPYPSQTDVNYAAGWPGVEWIIVGVARGGATDVRSYIIDGAEITEVPLEVGGQGRRMIAEPLVCPRCAEPHPLDERFCRECNMPLVYSGALGVDEPITERHERARKIKPQYAEGDLVHAIGARNQTEAEFIQGMLLEEGVPSVLRRTRGFDVPDMLAAGPRDVLVPLSGREAAREVLLQAEMLDERDITPAPGRVMAGLLATVALVGLIAWIGTEIGF